MKAIQAFEWAVKTSINFEYIGIIEVPEEGDDEWQQNEAWWVNQFGSVPPAPVASGLYMYFYASQIADDVRDERGAIIEPDTQIELCNDDTAYGYDYINLYLIEE